MTYVKGEDADLTPDQLSEKYDPSGGGQHPEYTRYSWQCAVMSYSTLRGYWDWVHAQIEEE